MLEKQGNPKKQDKKDIGVVRNLSDSRQKSMNTIIFWIAIGFEISSISH